MEPLNLETINWSLFDQFDEEIRSFYDEPTETSVTDISDAIILPTLTSGEDYE